jgi:hypothetical protein
MQGRKIRDIAVDERIFSRPVTGARVRQIVQSAIQAIRQAVLGDEENGEPGCGNTA